jgi:hypothetical protein
VESAGKFLNLEEKILKSFCYFWKFKTFSKFLSQLAQTPIRTYISYLAPIPMALAWNILK